MPFVAIQAKFPPWGEKYSIEAARGSFLSQRRGAPAAGGWPGRCTASLLGGGGVSPRLPLRAGIYRDAVDKALTRKEKGASWFDGGR